MKQLRVILADDHQMLLEGLGQILANSCELVGVATNGRELVALGKKLKPDVIITDIDMPEMGGVEAIAELRKEGITPKVIFLTMLGETETALNAFRSGGDGYILKHSAGAELVNAIQEVMAGRTYLTPRIARNVLTAAMHPESTPAKGSTPPLELVKATATSLTPRQVEVLRLVTKGKTMKEIAAVMEISTRTAEAHKYQMMEHLGLKTVAELIQYGIRSGLVVITASGVGLTLKVPTL
ncbi:MAG: response regulator transcription factor [Nibricoccus sp.]